MTSKSEMKGSSCSQDMTGGIYQSPLSAPDSARDPMMIELNEIVASVDKFKKLIPENLKLGDCIEKINRSVDALKTISWLRTTFSKDHSEQIGKLEACLKQANDQIDRLQKQQRATAFFLRNVIEPLQQGQLPPAADIERLKSALNPQQKKGIN